MEKMTLAELNAHLDDAKSRAKDLAAQFADRDFPDDVEAEFAALNDEIAQTKDKIAKREAREAVLAELSERDENTENEARYQLAPRGKRTSRIPDDPTNLDEYRTRATGVDDLQQLQRDGARKIIETSYRNAHPYVSREEGQHDLDLLLGKDQEVALRTIATSSKGYRREFEQYCQTGTAGPEMQRASTMIRAASIGTTTAGGFAVPVELDTTLLLTNAGVVNPIRNLAKVRQTNGNTYEFLNTTGITAGFGNEATEASDNTPVLAQPTVNIEKAFAFVPMSIEVASDWANIQEDLAMGFADAKNQLESDRFLKGLGHASHEPQGLIAAGGATAVVSTATTAVFAVADLYSLELALSPRYRQNASIVGNKGAYQKVRQFDTAGGANLWVQLQNDNPPELIGYNAYEWSNYASTTTTSGSTILTMGDFNYFGIVDRVGMNVEFIPHLFGGSNRYPTGSRGLYMWWRTSSQILSPTVQVNSAFVSLKVL